MTAAPAHTLVVDTDPDAATLLRVLNLLLVAGIDHAGLRSFKRGGTRTLVIETEPAAQSAIAVVVRKMAGTYGVRDARALPAPAFAED
ncbi:MAG: hypothetical protein NW203_14230 [Hyphomonadaceae bacterium]|nr:hypothetical protein [Hyphomonadaceae bacterium]